MRLLVGIVLVGSIARPAPTCESGVWIRRVIPAPDATNVPLNARIWLFYNNEGLIQPTVRLLDDGEQEVATTLELLSAGGVDSWSDWAAVITPNELLLPERRYTIDGYYDDGFEPLRQTFTTGSETDTSSPAFDGALDVTAAFVPGDPDSSCNAPDFHEYTISANAAADAAAYRLYGTDTTLPLLATQDALPVVYREVGSGDPPNRCFILRAVDLAGNESQWNGWGVCYEVPEDCGCGGCPCDWVRDDPDDPSAPLPQRTGCSCTLGQRRSQPALAVLLLFAALPFTRTRWRRSRGCATGRGTTKHPNA